MNDWWIHELRVFKDNVKGFVEEKVGEFEKSGGKAKVYEV